MPFSWSRDLLSSDSLHFLERCLGAGIYWLDIATQKVIWSDGVYEIFDLTPGSVTPSRNVIRDMIHPDDRRPIDEMDRIYSSGNAFQIEYRIITRNRHLRWISNRGEFLIDAAGRPASVFGVLQDVSSRHHSADSIEDLSDRLDTVLKLQKAIAWTSTPDGYLTSIPNWETVFSGSEEPLGHKIFEIMHPEDREQSRQDWANALARGDEYASEHRILHPDGDYRWRRCSALPIKPSDGKIREWLGMTIDIEDLKTGGTVKKAAVGATGAQIRAARSILRLSVKDLSDVSGVPVGAIRRIEDIDGLSKDDLIVSALLRTELEKRGTIFIFPASFKPAVCPA